MKHSYEGALRELSDAGEILYEHSHGGGFRLSSEWSPCPLCDGVEQDWCSLCDDMQGVPKWVAIAYWEAKLARIRQMRDREIAQVHRELKTAIWGRKS